MPKRVETKSLFLDIYRAAAEKFAEIMRRKSGINDLMRTRRMLVRAESRRILSDSFEVDVSARGSRGRKGR